MRNKANICVLFVDDDPELLSALQRFLRREAFQCIFVSSGTEALDVLAQRSIDIVVSDLRMPQMDGVTLLKKVKEGYSNVRRMLLSAAVDEKTLDDCRDSGLVHQFMMKPIKPQTLRHELNQSVDMLL